MHRLTRQQARRIAVQAQLLDAPRPSDLLEVVRRLTLLQVDFTAAVAHSADLVCWSRLGSAYRPERLTGLCDSGALVELEGMLRPAEDVALYQADMADWPGRGELSEWQVDLVTWVRANGECREEVLALLRSDGPLPSSQLPDTCAVPWRSSGWNNNRSLRRLLASMEGRGEVAVAAREGREPLWDLAERVFPGDATVPAGDALAERNRRRLAALGIARGRAAVTPNEPNDVGTAGEEAVIDGVRGTWRVDPAQLGRPFRGRAALLSPLDRLVFDRKRLAEVFESDYQLEMYKPAGRRQWGYWALPVLYGDRLVGKLDATADRDAGVLRVDGLHEDVAFTATMRAAVDKEIRGLARWLDLELTGAR